MKKNNLSYSQPTDLTIVDRVLASTPTFFRRPDVILMDINLPGISGIDALRILAADSATARIPVVALSANAMPHDIEKGLAIGFFRYLTKPIKVKEFMDTLDAAMRFAEMGSIRLPVEETE